MQGLPVVLTPTIVIGVCVYGPSASSGNCSPESMLYTYGVSKTVTRTLSCWAIAKLLFMLPEYGFQPTIEPHCKPLQYKVSSRGKAGAILALGMSVLSVIGHTAAKAEVGV